MDILALLLGSALAAQAAGPMLAIVGDGAERQFTTAALADRPDSAVVTVPDDGSCRRAMRYRAVPLRDLFGSIDGERFDTLKARATYGFVTQIPLALIACQRR